MNADLRKLIQHLVWFVDLYSSSPPPPPPPPPPAKVHADLPNMFSTQALDRTPNYLFMRETATDCDNAWRALTLRMMKLQKNAKIFGNNLNPVMLGSVR